MKLPASVLVKSQKKAFRASYTEGGKPHVIIAHVRHDDECGNGHNTFSITGEIYNGYRQPGEATIETDQGLMWMQSCGCIHEDIAKRFPNLAPLIKWHLVSTDEPMHFVSNTLYHAGDRDCWCLRKDEVRQIKNGKTGKLAWTLEATAKLDQYVDADECPPATATLRYVPWNKIGEGKARELDHARSSAVWPEATDQELMQEPEVLKAALIARLPKLMQAFKAAVESLGFTY